MIPARSRGWELRLLAVIEDYKRQSMEWGRYDCLTQVADVCEAMTGHDPMAGQRGRYRSEGGAARVLKELGFSDVEEALAATFPEVAVAQARRGDCGIILMSGMKASVVVLGTNVIGRHTRGSFLMPSLRMSRAFRVGW